MCTMLMRMSTLLICMHVCVADVQQASKTKKVKNLSKMSQVRVRMSRMISMLTYCLNRVVRKRRCHTTA